MTWVVIVRNTVPPSLAIPIGIAPTPRHHGYPSLPHCLDCSSSRVPSCAVRAVTSMLTLLDFPWVAGNHPCACADLAFWGNRPDLNQETGGCCHNSNDEGNDPTWGRPMIVSYVANSESPTASPTTMAPSQSPSPSPTTPIPTTAPVAAMTCGPGTVAVSTVCTAVPNPPSPPPPPPPPPPASYCRQGTMLQGGGCVPNCDDLRRRSIDCPYCTGLPTTPPPTTMNPTAAGETFSPTAAPTTTAPTVATTTTVPELGAETAAEEDADSGTVGIVVAILVLFAAAAFFVARRQSKAGAAPSQERGKENPMYEQPNGKQRTDGFGFGGNADAGDGYLEVATQK